MKRVMLALLVLAIAAPLAGGTAFATTTASPSWFAGVWQTTYGVMKIKQTGAAFSATYGSSGYSVTGTVSGRTLRGTWKEGASTGKVYFTISTDGSSFKGAFGDGAEPPTRVWSGTVTSHAAQPTPGAATPKNGGGPKAALTPSNFAGVWQTTYGAMKIKQTGAAFSATYGSSGYSVTGTVTGRTLRGTWKEGPSTGKVYFTISTDGASFKGAFGDGAEPPTRVWTGTKS